MERFGRDDGAAAQRAGAHGVSTSESTCGRGRVRDEDDAGDRDEVPDVADARLGRGAPRPGDAPSLRALLDARTAPGVLFERLASGDLRCTACAHRCVMTDGRAGACGVRRAAFGELRVPHGYVARRYVRAVETNTIYHVLPGAKALTFGMFGCDLRCPYCHNWRVSQAVRDDVPGEAPIDVTPADVVQGAIDAGCRVLCAAYNEPMISAEWGHAIFAEAKRRGLVTAVISDGNSTPEALAYMRDVTDVFRVDLKGSSNEQYRALGGRLDPVLASIAEARRLGYWVEVVTLVVPGFNDDPRGIRALARELLAIDADVPWHLNAFYPRYRMQERPRTSAGTLVSLAGIAAARGLRYVYVGNVASEVDTLSHTRCPSCFEEVVRRSDYATLSSSLDGARCPRCAATIAGIFAPAAARVTTGE